MEEVSTWLAHGSSVEVVLKCQNRHILLFMEFRLPLPPKKKQEKRKLVLPFQKKVKWKITKIR